MRLLPRAARHNAWTENAAQPKPRARTATAAGPRSRSIETLIVTTLLTMMAVITVAIVAQRNLFAYLLR